MGCHNTKLHNSFIILTQSDTFSRSTGTHFLVTRAELLPLLCSSRQKQKLGVGWFSPCQIWINLRLRRFRFRFLKPIIIRHSVPVAYNSEQV